MSTRSFEIYYNDLNEDAKRRYLKFQRVEDASELNHEISPLGIIDAEDRDPCDSCKKQGKATCAKDTVNYSCHEEE